MVKELPKSNGSVLGFEITGKVTMEQETEWLSRFAQITKRWLMKHMSQFNKIAVVIDKNIWKWFITIGSVFEKMLEIGSILNRRGYK